MLRSSWARPGSAQIAFSTWRFAVAQLKLGRFFWYESEPSRSISCAMSL
jgi:hypothetical protein